MSSEAKSWQNPNTVRRQKPTRSHQGRKKTSDNAKRRRQLLVLHGSRQTGQLLLGRMEKLQKKLKGLGVELVAPDAPFDCPQDAEMRQWWNRDGDNYQGLETSLDMLQEMWNNRQDCSFEGILGFSMGARLAHLMVLCQEWHEQYSFRGLKYCIMVSGYDAPIPTNLNLTKSTSGKLTTPSLHVWGEKDKLITPSQSRAVMASYEHPQTLVHEGGHHVPMKAANIQAYIDFVREHANDNSVEEAILQPLTREEHGRNGKKAAQRKVQVPQAKEPDKEAKMAQQDEVEALSAIFPDEFTLLSKKLNNDAHQHPISYRIDLPTTDDDGSWWPPHPVALHIEYPHDYPSTSIPTIHLVHENNVMDFSSAQTQALQSKMLQAAEQELGMPSVLSCVYAAREFFESGQALNLTTADAVVEPSNGEIVQGDDNEPVDDSNKPSSGVIQQSCAARIQECNLQGLEIARSLLMMNGTESLADSTKTISRKRGSWQYSIGLVGKPSAGKSTFFNAATGFARQRHDADNALGGATMAPHPFTTIDPNVGYCLVPAPKGSCPEEFDSNYKQKVGCTHGRDHQGRRLIPVMLKDVAGLVPGAYQGRGRGNKFLNDLTDADVLIHVVDASGTADTEGNSVGVNSTEERGDGSHPLKDLAWIRNELIEWVYTNLMYKWDSIKRRGRNKLMGMFGGYGQNQAMSWDILFAVEKYMHRVEHRDHALDKLEEWDEADVHRLVSAFLGVRFPMALALNKEDLPSAQKYIPDVEEALPVHGAHVGIPMSAESEMKFVRRHLDLTNSSRAHSDDDSSPPTNIWQCLQSAVMLREPILVFPVADMTTYAPLTGLTGLATEDSSLPSGGMIDCLLAAGGSAPSSWNGHAYEVSKHHESCMLRDVLIMKPGSTVEDVFLSLKRLGALAGEFVRAEGAEELGAKAKLVPKDEVIGHHNRIVKIMTNKRHVDARHG